MVTQRDKSGKNGPADQKAIGRLDNPAKKRTYSFGGRDFLTLKRNR
jgi:hypothetical protein